MRKHILPILLVLLMILLAGCSKPSELPQNTEISSSSVGQFSELKQDENLTDEPSISTTESTASSTENKVVSEPTESQEKEDKKPTSSSESKPRKKPKRQPRKPKTNPQKQSLLKPNRLSILSRPQTRLRKAKSLKPRVILNPYIKFLNAQRLKHWLQHISISTVPQMRQF